MQVTNEDIRRVLVTSGLRVTDIRMRVFRVLAESPAPLSHREAVERLGEVDRVSVFRNLVALAEVGLVRRMELGDHTWRFELVRGAALTPAHQHTHFTCTSCGEVSCFDHVDVNLRSDADPSWARWLDGAEVHLRGQCGACRVN